MCLEVVKRKYLILNVWGYEFEQVLSEIMTL